MSSYFFPCSLTPWCSCPLVETTLVPPSPAPCYRVGSTCQHVVTPVWRYSNLPAPTLKWLPMWYLSQWNVLHFEDFQLLLPPLASAAHSFRFSFTISSVVEGLDPDRKTETGDLCPPLASTVEEPFCIASSLPELV